MTKLAENKTQAVIFNVTKPVKGLNVIKSECYETLLETRNYEIFSHDREQSIYIVDKVTGARSGELLGVQYEYVNTLASGAHISANPVAYVANLEPLLDVLF